VDSCGPELAQVTGVAQVLTNGQHEILHGAFGAVDRRGQATGAVAPVHAIQALIASACHPALHGGQGHANAVRDLAQGSASPDRFDHLTPSLTEVGFLLMAGSSSVSCHAKRVALTSECLHLGDIRVLALAR
jgi:hypothetical protein